MNEMQRATRLTVALCALTFALSACGGGSSSGISSPSPQSKSITLNVSLPGATLAASTGRAAPSSGVRRPQSASSTAGSITVSINGGTPQLFELSSSNCTGTNPLVCSLTVVAPYGNDVFTVVTYSGQNATGSQVYEAALTITVSASTPTTLAVAAGTLLVVTSSADTSGGSDSCASGSTTCTLREAVAEASTTAGNFTTITFQGVSTLTVGSPITISSTGNQSIAILGPATTAVQSGTGAPSAASGLTISGGGSSQIFVVNAGGNLIVDGLTLTDGVSSDAYGGGAIENHGGLSIINTVFSGNSAAGADYGGAVYDDGVNTTIAYSTFSGNSAYEGGAYWEDNGATFTHCLFNANTAYYATDAYGEGGAIDAYWNLSVSSSTFTANVAGSTSAVSNTEAYGGAIAFWDGNVSLTVTDSTFGGSSASLGNYAGGASTDTTAGGGAIFDENDNELLTVMSNNTFSNNEVQGYDVYGGAVVAYYGANASGDTYTNNVADGNTEEGYAGAPGAYIYGDGPSTLTNETFTGNSALGYYEAYGNFLYWVNGSNLTFTNNTASSSAGYEYGEAYGAGAYAYYGTLTNATFSGNSATSTYYTYGGGLFTDEEGFGLSNVSFTSNSANVANQTYTYAYAFGGGLYEDPPPLSSSQAANATSTSPQSGSHARTLAALAARDKLRAANAARLAAHQPAARKGAAFPRSSKAAARGTQVKALPIALPEAALSGQRVSPQSGTVPWSNLTFSGNTANAGPAGYEAAGGGLYFDDEYISIITATFTSNAATAGSSGAGYGGAFLNEDNMVFTGTVTNNTATTEGGGAYNDDYLQITSSTFSGNSVTAVQNSYDGGGAIYNDDELFLSSSTLTGNSVAGTVAGSGGGGLFNLYQATLTNVTLAGNTSSQNGGGIENQNYETSAQFLLTVVNATIFGNTATVAGGSIDNNTSATLKLQNTIAAGGTPSSSEVNNTATLTSLDYNLIQGTITGTFTAAAHDKLGMSPALASGLASNGGPTQTLADTSSSPGAGYIPFAGGCGTTGPSVDQRGYTRGTGGVCDIGAFELNGVAPSQQTQSSARRR